MKSNIISASIVIVVLAFGQAVYKGGDARLSPCLLNYQGFLTDTLNNPINDSLDITFRIYDAVSSGNIIWFETQFEVPVLKGIFHILLGSVTPIPDSVFTKSANRWLELRVSNQSLTPRTRITSAPYAITSTYADTALYVKNGALDNDWTFLVTDGADTTLQTGGRWGLARAGNVLYGNADSTHVNFGVACTTGLSGQNFKYCTVVGGIANKASGFYSTASGGTQNVAGNSSGSSCATVGGGAQNSASGSFYPTVGGGYSNEASGYTASTVTGGYNNTAGNDYAFVGGGQNNIASSTHAAILGGLNNAVSGWYSAVGGGNANAVVGRYSTVGGGYADTVQAYYGIIGSGYSNYAGDEAADSAIVVAGGWDNSATGRFDFIGGGAYNTARDHYAVIGGGIRDTVKAVYGSVLGGYSNLAGDASVDTAATVVGGWNNSAAAKFAYIGGGSDNSASAYYSTVSGGVGNQADSNYSTISGGQNNAAGGSYATVGGGWGNSSGINAAVIGGGNNTASGYYSTVGGGQNHDATGEGSSVDGGYSNTAGGYVATVGGGQSNLASGLCATVGGGTSNSAKASYTTVSGGAGNQADSNYSTVSGGQTNTAGGPYATVSGGRDNTANNWYATVSGGRWNTASGSYATVGGGLSNTASGEDAYVGGGSSNAAEATLGFATNYSTYVISGHNNSAAFTTSHTTGSNQARAAAFSTGTIDFAMDHPDDPMDKILNQYGVSSDEVQSQYSGSAILGDDGRATVNLPDYFDDINRNPRIQLTGVGSADVVYVAEKIKSNRFVIAGKPGMEVYWEVTAERKDIQAEIARVQTPVVQDKQGDLRGHSIDDDAMIGIYDGIKPRNPELFTFKTEEGRNVHEQSKITGTDKQGDQQ